MRLVVMTNEGLSRSVAACRPHEHPLRCRAIVDLAESLLSDFHIKAGLTKKEVTTYLQIHRAMVEAAYFEGKHLTPGRGSGTSERLVQLYTKLTYAFLVFQQVRAWCAAQGIDTDLFTPEVSLPDLEGLLRELHQAVAECHDQYLAQDRHIQYRTDYVMPDHVIYRGLECIWREGAWHGIEDRYAANCFMDHGDKDHYFGSSATFKGLMAQRDDYYRKEPIETAVSYEDGYLYRRWIVVPAKIGPYWFAFPLDEYRRGNTRELEHVAPHTEYQDMFRAIDRRYRYPCDLCGQLGAFWPSHEKQSRRRIFVCEQCNELVGRWNDS